MRTGPALREPVSDSELVRSVIGIPMGSISCKMHFLGSGSCRLELNNYTLQSCRVDKIWPDRVVSSLPSCLLPKGREVGSRQEV